MRKSLLVSASVASAFVLLVACSGTSSVSIPGTGDGTDAATAPKTDGATPGDGAVIKDAAVTSDASDPPKDAGVSVKELPAPDCHDLKQVGPVVMTTFGAGQPPAPVPLTAIMPGLYVVKEITDYGQISGFNNQSQITAYFTGTREYYIADDGNPDPTVYSLDYKVTNGVLSRSIICPPDGQSIPDYRIGASTNGFTIYVTQNGGSVTSTELVRYEHAN